MIKCHMCDKDAVCRDKSPVGRGDNQRYLYYCSGHKKAGLLFGWLEKDELEEVKG